MNLGSYASELSQYPVAESYKEGTSNIYKKKQI